MDLLGNKVFIYALFADIPEEIDRESKGLLKPPPYPRVMDTETTQARWVQETARKYDQFTRLSAFGTRRAFLGDSEINEEGRFISTLEITDCTTYSDEDEAELLKKMWTCIQDASELYGWQINEVLWPRIINRTIHNGMSVPTRGHTDLSKKYLDLPHHDIAKIYQMGVYSNYVRPVPRIDQVLSFWHGEIYANEDTLEVLANAEPDSEEIDVAICGYTEGMAKAYCNYTGLGLRWI